ncbi:MAG: Methylthioribose-1-phosphate isomerase MtnA, eIF-2B-like [Candidatus Methanohalarchaeum thermophilum]|uniref:Putative methylthioribose-1-phosphate isomerase n=1 Tax=Methanohalarchaeum thermophilum TaxID=1903181 RepID=A0A1Q6DTJ2_METT1|nr:MAG: Methylthioribose-1-phosphate isomerase MtnA, eIF-2B-like [Candidatus Methanohalarchaeum thermophilum]
METVRFEKDKLIIIDQTKLPSKKEFIELETYKDVVKAIKNMKVRGAPAIGVTAAFGLVLASKNGDFSYLKKAARELKQTRPTAVNLFWAINEVLDHAKKLDEWEKAVRERAIEIFKNDRKINEKISENGSEVISDGDSVLTHCNAGALATSGIYGTALGVIKRAKEKEKEITVYCTETRPVLQGARLTAYELIEDIEVNTRLIVDNAVGSVMPDLDKVVVGADRVLKDGVANKIGTYQIATLADRHDVDFYVAAPKSTFDLDKSKKDLDIEIRDEKEIKEICGCMITPKNVKAHNPAFDVTPLELIDGIINEEKIINPEKEM